MKVRMNVPVSFINIAIKRPSSISAVKSSTHWRTQESDIHQFPNTELNYPETLPPPIYVYPTRSLSDAKKAFFGFRHGKTLSPLNIEIGEPSISLHFLAFHETIMNLSYKASVQKAKTQENHEFRIRKPASDHWVTIEISQTASPISTFQYIGQTFEPSLINEVNNQLKSMNRRRNTNSPSVPSDLNLDPIIEPVTGIPPLTSILNQILSIEDLVKLALPQNSVSKDQYGEVLKVHSYKKELSTQFVYLPYFVFTNIYSQTPIKTLVPAFGTGERAVAGLRMVSPTRTGLYASLVAYFYQAFTATKVPWIDLEGLIDICLSSISAACVLGQWPLLSTYLSEHSIDRHKKSFRPVTIETLRKSEDTKQQPAEKESYQPPKMDTDSVHAKKMAEEAARQREQIELEFKRQQEFKRREQIELELKRRASMRPVLINIDPKGYYKFLGLSGKEYTATEQDIHNAYLDLVKVYHPDTKQSIEEKTLAKTNFIKLKLIYEILSDTQKRRAYDSGKL